MTKNRRYEASYDALNDKRVAEALKVPCTLPNTAYGAEPIEWVRGQAKPARLGVADVA